MSAVQVFGQGYPSLAFSVPFKNKIGSLPLENEQITAPILIDEADAEVVSGSDTGYWNCIKPFG